MSIPLEKPRDPLVPRPIDLYTPVPLDPDADLDAARHREDLRRAGRSGRLAGLARRLSRRWREEAAARIGYDDSAYAAPEYAWTRSCHVVALAWLWDELLFDHDAGRFTPERFCAESEREFGGFDGIVLWHAYPVIGIDDRNQFDFYRDVPGIRELVAELQARGLRVFVNYNPWDVGTRREPVADDLAIAELVRELGVDGVFLDTMKEAQPGLRAALDAVKAGDRARGRVDAAAGAHLRPPPLVGAVVLGQRRPGRAPGALVRAAAHAPSHPPLEPRPHRGAAQRLAERRRRARLGERLRRLGRLERARQGAAARDAAGAAASTPS